MYVFCVDDITGHISMFSALIGHSLSHKDFKFPDIIHIVHYVDFSTIATLDPLFSSNVAVNI